MSLRLREVFVRGLRIDAAIGIYDHEHGRTQPLLIDATIRIDTHPIRSIKDTLNYETIGTLARGLIARGHIKLVETLAEELATALCAERSVQSVDVTVRKLSALADADAAGVRVVFENAPPR